MNPRIFLILTIGISCSALAVLSGDAGPARAAMVSDAHPLAAVADRRSQPSEKAETSTAKLVSNTAIAEGQGESRNAGMTGAGRDSLRVPLGCFCGLDTEGQDFCFQDEECGLVRACASSADCGTGERCVATNCCAAPLDFACFAACNEGCVGGGDCNSYQACVPPPPPPNDECVFAEDVVGLPSQVIASTVDATFDAAPFCDTDNTAPGVWYRVMGTGNTMRASMCTEFVGYDPKISVYCGGCDVLNCVAGNDDGNCTGLPSTFPDVSWCSIAGAEYLILVHGYLDQVGGFTLNFSDDPTAPCDGRVSCVAGDDCLGANLIPSVPFSTTFDNSTALADGPPGTCNSALANVMDNDVWFSYKPGVDCELSVKVNPDAGGAYDGIAAVYKGPDCLNLTELMCLDDPQPMLGNVSVTAGVTYWIQIGDWGTSPGGGLTGLDVDCVPKSVCCIQGDCVDGMLQEVCLSQQGTWFDGVTCANFACPEACCSPSGGCTMAVPGACLEVGGIPQGPGSTCASVTCNPIDCGQSSHPVCGGVCPAGEQCVADLTAAFCTCQAIPCEQGVFPTCGGTCPAGSVCVSDAAGGNCRCQADVACCLRDGTCGDMQPQACVDNGGEPQAPGSTCANATCVPVGACCAPTACVGGGNCDTGVFSNRCGGTFDCFCFDTAEGGVSCAQSHLCSSLTPCPNGTRDCQPNETCNVNSCCGGAFCEPVDCLTGRNADDLAPADPSSALGGLTSAGVLPSRGGVRAPNCLETTREDCVFLDGTYMGDASFCADVTCGAPSTVACCLPDGACADLTPNVCRDRGGFPRGPDSACQGDLNGDGADDACRDAPCEHCGGFSHWVDQCAPGVDSMPSGALVGIDMGANLDCIPDTNLVLRGPVHVRRIGPLDDSTVFPGTRPVDNHLDVLDTEMVQLVLTGGGVTMTAGAAQDVAGLLPPTFGVIAEQPAEPLLADSFFDVFFTVELPGGPILYNHDPLKVTSKIDCIPPDTTYIHPTGCIPLYDTPPGTIGQVVANLVAANHSTYPTCGDPGTGDCYEPHDAPFCNDAACCQTACQINPDCCGLGWTAACVALAQETCSQACCLPDGTCRDTTAADCGQAGGFPQGPGSGCDGVVCQPVACDQSPFPVCGGACPSGERCVTGLTSGVCACEPIPCDQSFPACGGACPAGSECVSVPGAAVCRCAPIECQPNADGTACNGAPCLDVGTCNARCVDFDPTTGAQRIVDCACRDASECHVASVGSARGLNPCTVPDNGTGTVTLPPQGCQYLSPDEVHEIIDGLPPGTTIELTPIHKDFICGDRPGSLCSLPLAPGVCEDHGGSLGGSGDCFDSTLALIVNGTGALSGFTRTLFVPVGCEVHTGPRNSGDPVQTFPTEMFRLQGELFGDPDFCTLKVTGGRDFGLPSPGETTLTRLPSGDFNVDSFFDVTYQIEFSGCPGSVLEGLSGVTTATIRMQTGEGIAPPSCTGVCPPNTECRRTATPNADGTITVCCDCVTPEPPVACCLPQGECANVTPLRCEELGGVSKGPGTACEGDINGNGVDDACEDEPCEDCGPGPHWVDECAPGVDSMPSGALVGLDLGPVFDCIPDTNLVLRGPVHIGRAGPSDDSNHFPGLRPIDAHLDVIDTEMLSLNLTGGGVTLRAGAGQGVAGVLPSSLGAIAEQPTQPDWADSFFDVFFEVDTGAQLAYNHQPVRVNSKIDCLPPDTTYIHPIGCIPLFDTPRGIAGQVVAQLVTANHSTYPACGDPGTGPCREPHDAPFCRDEKCCNRVCEQLPHCCSDAWDLQCAQAALEVCQDAVEVDQFDFSIGALELHHPDGNVETIPVSGPATVHVFFEGPNEGDANDDNGNGRDEVRTEMVDLALNGFSPKLGPIHVTINPARPSLGAIEELVNNNPGLLDVDPFAPGDADSFFDIFFKVEIGGMEFFTVAPKRMRSRIDTKPPGPTSVYENVERLELFDANGNQTGFFLGATRHRPSPTTEVDVFDFSIGQFDLKFPDGSVKSISVGGPTTVNVYFEGPHEGDANDDNGNGRDEVSTEMVSLNLTGYHPDLGAVTIGVHPTIPSLGQMEELTNNTPGTLDVRPFTSTGVVDSFFDIFFEIHVGGVRYFTHSPKRMKSRIDQKPPGPTSVYENPNDVELFTEDGEPTGIFLSAARHRPRPVVEVDQFDFSVGRLDLQFPDGSLKTISVGGPATVNVYFDGPNEGDADDSNGNGRDDVVTEMVALDLVGYHPDLGPVEVGVHPTIPSLGRLEELTNNTPGTLDVRPFTPTGVVDSFFDIFFEIRVGGVPYFTKRPKRMSSRIDQKPPGPTTVYQGLDEIELFDENGEPTGIFLTAARHRPNPVVEVDDFDFSIGQFELLGPDGTLHQASVAGQAVVHVYFEGPHEGDAGDGDGNGLDEVQTEMVALNLTGDSDLGPIQVRLHPGSPSLGMIEEQVNHTPGVLDVRPFADGGTADSFFDIFFEIDVAGLRLFTPVPKRMSSVIAHKPPGPGALYEDPRQIALLFEDGQPSGYILGATRHRPNPLEGTDPPACAIDARQPHPVNSPTPKQGWNQLVLQFSTDPSALNLQPGDFALDVVPPSLFAPPIITNVLTLPGPQQVIVVLNRPIDPGHWTCIEYVPSGRRWCLGFLPSDVNQNRLGSSGDILDLINSLNGVPGRVLPLYATDIDRSTAPNSQDILREIDLLNGAGSFRVWLSEELPRCPQEPVR